LGCLAKVVVASLKKVKKGQKTIDCVFIGYTYNNNIYWFLVHKLGIKDINPNTVIESRWYSSGSTLYSL